MPAKAVMSFLPIAWTIPELVHFTSLANGISKVFGNFALTLPASSEVSI
jgi:hypothetical protein